MLHNKIQTRRFVWAKQIHRIMVNIKSLRIFNGIFETQKLTQNAEKIAKMRAWKTSVPRVYHCYINYDGALRDTNGPLSDPASGNFDRL
jgi:hypothetical protein